jgi:phosphomannomutase
LSHFDFRILNLGICPTPIILHANKKLEIHGGVVISGSHNTHQWNALKLLSETSFVCDNELEEIKEIYKNTQFTYIDKNSGTYKNKVKKYNATESYIKDLKKIINFRKTKRKNKLKVIIDTGAGAGKRVTPKILKKLGCSIIVINNELKDDNFPRKIEPIEKNLHDLITTVWKEKGDIGFAHDSDADRLTIVGDDYKCYSEDVSLAIIFHHYLKMFKEKNKAIKFITNVASSLMFEKLAENYDAKIFRTPIGECYVAEKMNRLLGKRKDKDQIIFGGEASCGGVMFPEFNNARDGILAAAKIIEILVSTQKKVSELVSELPTYASYRITLDTKDRDIEKLITYLKEELILEGEKVAQIGLDLRFGQSSEWFVLIHPSTTEHKIRIISEAKRKALAKLYCETTLELLKIVESRLE